MTCNCKPCKSQRLKMKKWRLNHPDYESTRKEYKRNWYLKRKGFLK